MSEETTPPEADNPEAEAPEPSLNYNDLAAVAEAVADIAIPEGLEYEELPLLKFPNPEQYIEYIVLKPAGRVGLKFYLKRTDIYKNRAENITDHQWIDFDITTLEPDQQIRISAKLENQLAEFVNRFI